MSGPDKSNGSPSESLPIGTASEFRFPAQWEPQSAVWLAWPHNRNTWPNRFAPLPEFYRRWARLIAESTPVRILAAGEAKREAESMVGSDHNIEVVDVPTNDCWVRDFGPTFVHCLADHTVAAVDWRFNAWGGKYAPWDADQEAARLMCQHAAIQRYVSSFCLEGGAIETDGRGRMLTTPTCTVTPTRNPGCSADDLSRQFYERLGVTEIVWIDGGGLAGDDTDGHIDQLARFVTPDHVVVAVCDASDGENHSSLESNYRQLHLWGDTTSPGVQVHRLPIPPARAVEGTRVPESYCNFLRLGPDRILVPTFSASTDEPAIDLLSQLSGANVIGVDCRDLVWGLGALHCASRDQPSEPSQPVQTGRPAETGSSGV